MIIIAAHGDNYADKLVESIKKYTPNEKFKVIKSDGYCIKSYLIGAEPGECMFMHDSMEVKDSKWLQRFRDKDTGGIVAHSVFPFRYDNDDQKKFIDLPDGDVGVFGPIFYTKNFDFIKPYFEAKIPSNVNEMRAWERGLGCVCKHLNIPIESVYGEFNYDNVLNDRLEGLRKVFLLRD